MDPTVAATIVALRPAIETLVINASNDPENVNAPNAQEDKTIQVVRQLCKMNSARHGMEQVGMGGFQTRRPPRSFQGGNDDNDFGNGGPSEPKRGNFNQMFGGRGYGSG